MALRIIFALLLLEKGSHTTARLILCDPSQTEEPPYVLDKNYEDPYYSSSCLIPVSADDYIYLTFVAWSITFQPGHWASDPRWRWKLFKPFINQLDGADEDNPVPIQFDLNPPEVQAITYDQLTNPNAEKCNMYFRIRTKASRHKDHSYNYFENKMISFDLVMHHFNNVRMPGQDMGNVWADLNRYSPLLDVQRLPASSSCDHFSCTGYSKCVQGRTHARCVTSCATLKCPEDLRCFQRNYWSAAECTVYPNVVLDDSALFEIHVFILLVLIALALAFTASCIRRFKKRKLAWKLYAQRRRIFGNHYIQSAFDAL